MQEVIEECMDDMECGDDTEWGNNVISNKAVQGPAGCLGYAGQVDAKPDPAALETCRAVSAKALEMAEDLTSDVWGCETGYEFEAFYVANHEGWDCTELSAAVAEKIFGGTLFPRATIELTGFEAIRESVREKEQLEDEVEQWDALCDWFLEHPEFTEAKCIEVHPPGDAENGGNVFPRLILGRLPDGSLAGLVNACTWT